MRIKCLNHKFLLNCCNIVFLICGTIILFAGFYVFSDSQRIILSRLLAATNEQLADLPQPVFYYIALGLGGAGTIAILASIIGIWASCLNTYCFLALDFLIVVILLLFESAACLAITLWPQCLGLNLDETKMVKAMQGNYGIPGQQQFTVAMDLAQVYFRCCGMSSDINYDTSLWRLQGYGDRDWIVPFTCCKLRNEDEQFAYLDPKPVNGSQCQTLQRIDYASWRYTEPCLRKLDAWYRQQHILFLAGSLVIAMVEFCVLLAIILNCTKKSLKANGSGRVKEDKIELQPSITATATTTQKNRRAISTIENAYDGGVMEAARREIKEVYKQPAELLKSRHNTTFKPMGNQEYQISRSYIV